MKNVEMVLQALADRGPMTSKEIICHTGLSKKAASKSIGRLAETGSIQRGADGVVSLKEKK